MEMPRRGVRRKVIICPRMTAQVRKESSVNGRSAASAMYITETPADASVILFRIFMISSFGAFLRLHNSLTDNHNRLGGNHDVIIEFFFRNVKGSCIFYGRYPTGKPAVFYFMGKCLL